MLLYADIEVFNNRCVAASQSLQVESTTVPCVDEEFAALYRNVGPQELKAHATHAKRQGVLLTSHHLYRLEFLDEAHLCWNPRVCPDSTAREDVNKCMIYSMDSVVLAEILCTTMLLFGWEHRITKTLCSEQSPLFSESATKSEGFRLDPYTLEDCWSWGKLARSASWYIKAEW